MKCPNCNRYLNLLQRTVLPHVCKAFPKIGPAFSDSRTEPWGRGQDWSPEVYGEYYTKSPVVYAAVKLRADALLSAPLTAYRRLSPDEREPLEPTHPLTVLLDHVNEFWTKNDLLRATSIYLDLWGSAFWVLKKAGPTSPPTEIWVMRPDKMHIVSSQARYIEGYWYQAPNGARIPFRRDEIIWMRNINPLDEYGGLSPIAPARLSIDMGQEGLRHNRNIFKNGILAGALAFMAKDGGSYTEEQGKEFREALKERYTKPENSHIPLIMGNFEAKNLGLTNRDMEFMAALRWGLEDVARVFSVPLPMLGDLSRATYENIDAAERIFWRSGMVPHLKFIEAELNEMLTPMFGDDLEVEFDLFAIDALQEDATTVAARDVADATAGIKTINEIRDSRGLEPVPWGDVWWAPFGLHPIESPEDAQPQLSPFGAPGALPEEEEEKPPTRRLVFSRTNTQWKKYSEPQYSDTFIGKVLELHDRGLTKSEGEFIRVQHRLFENQRREVLRRLDTQRFTNQLTAKALPHFDLFNLQDWIDRYIRVGASLYTGIVTLGAVQQSSAFSLNVAFDVRKIQEWIERRTQFWAQRVNEETARLLMQELEEGIAGGESIRKLQDRVERVFEFSDAVRSERIARTEVQAAMNEGAVESYRQSGVVERKMWLATLDSRVRDAHLEAHRQIVELETNFLVGGESISHPGEGSPENAINCRCMVAPIISRRALASPIEIMLNGHKRV